MDRAGSAVPILPVIVGTIAVAFVLFVGGLMLVSRSMMGSMMGGMMGRQGTGPSWWDVIVLATAGVVAVIAFAFAYGSLQVSRARAEDAPLPPAMSAPTQPPAAAMSPPDVAQVQRLQEAAVVRALDEDERRLYIAIREAGGSALQRDLVASGSFSKAKVTRLLDKLERRGLVVRERHGATNRVRLTWEAPPNA